MWHPRRNFILQDAAEGNASQQSGAEMILKIPEGVEVQPYEDICGKYVLDNFRSPITLKPEQIPPGFCRKKDLDKELEAALENDGASTLCGVGGSQDLGDKDLLENPLSEMNVASSEELVSKDLIPLPSSPYASSPVFDASSVFNGTTCPSSLPTLAALNSSDQVLKVGDVTQRGALVKSQRTGTVVGSTILVPSTEENSDFMNLTSISDVNILQTDEDERKDEMLKDDTKIGEEELKVNETDAKVNEGEVKINEEKLKIDEEELKIFKTKDDLLRENLTVCNSEHIRLVDVYLMVSAMYSS